MRQIIPPVPATEGIAGPAERICVRVDRAMRMLDIGKTKLYELIADGELETSRIGRRTLILRQSIDALISRLRATIA
jgi:excisionase family DNA binding protein